MKMHITSAKETCYIKLFIHFLTLNGYSDGEKVLHLCFEEQVDTDAVRRELRLAHLFSTVKPSAIVVSHTAFVPSPSDKSGFCPSVLQMIY